MCFWSGPGWHRFPSSHPHQGWVAACAQVLPEHRAGSCPGLQHCWCVSCKCCSWVITLHRAHLNFHVCKMWYLNLYLVWSGQELYVSGVVWAATGRSLMPSLATRAALIVLSQCSRADYGENWKLALSRPGIKGLQPGNKSCVVELKLNFWSWECLALEDRSVLAMVVLQRWVGMCWLWAARDHSGSHLLLQGSGPALQPFTVTFPWEITVEVQLAVCYLCETSTLGAALCKLLVSTGVTAIFRHKFQISSKFSWTVV